jgi:hypothetical protein
VLLLSVRIGLKLCALKLNPVFLTPKPEPTRYSVLSEVSLLLPSLRIPGSAAGLKPNLSILCSYGRIE